MHYSSVKRVVNIVRNMTIKSALNVAVNQLEISRQSSMLRSLPQIVDVVLTKMCNLKCIFCKDYETSGDKYVSTRNFEMAARQLFPTARLVSICSGGEPYLHRQLIDLLRIARQYKVETWLLSNGMLLREDLIRAIITEELISRHGFSVDGIKASTVEAIRVRANFDVIINNIKMLMRIREKECKKKPSIVIRYALMYSNIIELPDAVQYWGEMGVDTLNCSYLSLCNNIADQESLYFHQDLMKQIFNDAREVASHYPHLTVNLPPPIDQEEPKLHTPIKCDWPWRFVMIDTDGRVLPCYKSWGMISMGNLYGENGKLFKELWNSSQYQYLRRSVNDNALHKHFSYCSVCEYRFGMGYKDAHLNDATWLDYIPEASEKARVIANRSRNR